MANEPQYARRDVEVVRDAILAAEKAIENLQKLDPKRELSIAYTHLQEARLWVVDLANRTPVTL